MIATVHAWFRSLPPLAAAAIGVMLAFILWDLAEGIAEELAIPILREGLRADDRPARNLHPVIHGARLDMEQLLIAIIAFALVAVVIWFVFLKRLSDPVLVGSLRPFICPECKSEVPRGAKRCHACRVWIEGSP